MAFFESFMEGSSQRTLEMLSLIQQHFPEIKRLYIQLSSPSLTLSHRERVQEIGRERDWQIIYCTNRDI